MVLITLDGWSANHLGNQFQPSQIFDQWTGHLYGLNLANKQNGGLCKKTKRNSPEGEKNNAKKHI